jgi:hypothetical protein
MNHAIAPGTVPPPRGLEKEEPELAQEEDIPSDDDDPETPAASQGDERPLRNVERE